MFAGGLLLLAFLIPAGLFVSFIPMGKVTHGVRIGHPPDGAVHVAWHDSHPAALRFDKPAAVWKFSFFGILTFAGLALALICALGRRPTAAPESCAGHGRRWWPALLLVPLFLYLFVGTSRVRESRRHELAPPSPHHHGQLRMEARVREQEREIARRVAEIQRRIERMDIHELMDHFDAPRIVISGPQPAAIPWVALAQVAASSASRIGEVTSETASFLAEAAENDAATDDRQLQLEAAEGAKLVTAEAEWSDDTNENSDSADADASSHAEVTVEAAASVAPAADSVSESSPSPWVAAAEPSMPVHDAESWPKRETRRPDWVKAGSKRVGEVQREVLITDEWSTERECQRAADIALLLATYEHIQRLVGNSYEQHLTDYRQLSENSAEAHFRLHEMRSAGITVDYIRREIAKEEYLETTERSVGPMMKLYTLVDFSPSVDRELRNYWDSYRRQERLAAVGFGAGGILGLLGFAYGLLKVDTWTKGYYTKRLFLGVPAAIIGLMALVALAVELN
jgi:hypothetical protein